ncbi:hypothetical protein BDQ12DRAFT_589707, partial [Crucibulum laeve]
WKDYMDEAGKQDQINIGNWNQSMDVILIFAGLFSAILTAFLVEFYKPLQPDPNEAILNQLVAMTGILQISMGINATDNSFSVIQHTSGFNPEIAVVMVNILWFISLTCSLGAAIGAMVIKQWLQFYLLGLSPNAYEYSHQHQYRYTALINWHVRTIISALPLVMLVSVGLFLIGLGIQLVLLNTQMAVVTIGFISTVLLCYCITLAMPFLHPECPYKTS